MPIDAQTPQLDTRSFEDLKRQALLRIPRYTPEWTDWNESDPGVTVIELFAWLTEMMLYEMNRVPERNYLKFLQVLGLELGSAEPAVVHLSFTSQQGIPSLASVPQYTQVGGQSASGGDQLTYETTEGVTLIGLPLTDVQVFDGAAFTVVTAANTKPGTTFRPFGWQPLIGSALYFGFSPTTPAPAPLFPEEMRWRVFLPLNQISQPPIKCEVQDPSSAGPVPPVTLIWEYRPAGNPGFWRRLQVFEDQSAAFTREGAIMVEGPSQPTLTLEGRVADPRYWLRIRVAGGAYPAGMAPLVDFIRPNVVDAENLATVRNEPLGQSRGTFPQVFQLRRQPVVKDSLQLVVNEPGEDTTPWTRKDDLLGSGPDDRDFVLNAATGEISFGDGINGRLPVAGADIVALQYRYGGGEGGNLGAGLVNALLTPIVGVDKVTNERPAVGGRDEETIAHLIQYAPAKLRGNERAVSIEDFTALARSAGGIGNAIALPLFHPDHRGVDVAGVITVVVVPDNADRPPCPSPDQLEAVCTFLNQRRLLTTELYVKGPEYLPVEVEAVVEANPYAAFDVVRLQIIQALNAALDPMVPDPTAGKSTDGVTPRRTPGPRDFGEDFFPTKLYSVIQDVKDVRAVSISAVKINGQRVEDLRQRFRLDRDQMLYSAPEHTITVIPFKDL